MTDEQRAKRIHHHMYETCEGIAEHAERIVRLEEENEKLRMLAKAAWGCVKRTVSCEDCRIVACGCTLQSAMRELGILT